MACAEAGAPPAAGVDADGGAAASAAAPLRPLRVAPDGRIVDDLDRELLLRGVNITSIGEYWQGDPAHLPTTPMTAADWQGMAAQGFSVIRLVVHWSRLEPVRGQIDQTYLTLIDQYVQAAASHGLYTVIDMHQDAYTAALFTVDPSECTGTTAPAKGWDGAPAWAVRSDGLSTCISGDRNSSPAVRAAWSHFYANTDGIRDRFVATWGAVAAPFAGRPEVAGYNLLNEPEVPAPANEVGPLYQQLLAATALAIRAAEAKAGWGHLLIVEPAIAAGNPSFGVVVPKPASVGLAADDLVFGPHNYAEAIEFGLGTTIETMTQVYLAMAASFGAPTWIGEHGFWSASPDTVARAVRYAADEDANLLGGAWWQWRQPCGDPHSVPFGGYQGAAASQQIHLHGVSCPGDGDLGATAPLLRVVRRGYARNAPGRLVSLASDVATGALLVHGRDAVAGQQAWVWTPTTAATHGVSASGLGAVEEISVAASAVSGGGGRWLAAPALGGAWSLQVAPK